MLLLQIMGVGEGSKAQPRNYYNDPHIHILMYRSLLFENPECQWITLQSLLMCWVLGIGYTVSLLKYVIYKGRALSSV